MFFFPFFFIPLTNFSLLFFVDGNDDDVVSRMVCTQNQINFNNRRSRVPNGAIKTTRALYNEFPVVQTWATAINNNNKLLYGIFIDSQKKEQDRMRVIAKEKVREFIKAMNRIINKGFRQVNYAFWFWFFFSSCYLSHNLNRFWKVKQCIKCW